MKKTNLILLITATLTLTSCDLFKALINENTTDNNNQKEEGDKPSDISDDHESDKPSENENENDNPGDDDSGTHDDNPSEDKTKYDLNEYGDYIKPASSSMTLEEAVELYKKMDKKVAGVANGFFQTNYKKGLLDLFDINNRVELQINISEDNLLALQDDHERNNRESFRECSLDIILNGILFHYEGVGIRQKGNTSRGDIISYGNLCMRHFKISFEETFDDEFVENPKVWSDKAAKTARKDRKFFGMPKLDLRWNRNQDPTYLRETYAYEMYRNNGTLAPRTNLMKTSIKVGDRTYNLGLYCGVETLNKSFIKRNFIESAQGGNLYKIGWAYNSQGMTGGTFTNSDSSCFGVENQYKDGEMFRTNSYVFDLKTNKDDLEHLEIKNLIDALNQTSGETQRMEFYNNYMGYDSFITYSAVSYLLGDPDDLRGNDNNTYVYIMPDTHKAILIPTDHDRVLGGVGAGGNARGNYQTEIGPYDQATGYSGGNNALFNKSFVSVNVPQMRTDLSNKISSIINDGWMGEQFDNYIRKLYANYSSEDLAIDSSIYSDFYVANSIGKEEYSNYNLDIDTYFERKVDEFNRRK